jgi:hypothetical protein
MQGKLLEQTAMGQDAKNLGRPKWMVEGSKEQLSGSTCTAICSISKIVPVSSSFEKI